MAIDLPAREQMIARLRRTLDLVRQAETLADLADDIELESGALDAVDIEAVSEIGRSLARSFARLPLAQSVTPQSIPTGEQGLLGTPKTENRHVRVLIGWSLPEVDRRFDGPPTFQAGVVLDNEGEIHILHSNSYSLEEARAGYVDPGTRHDAPGPGQLAVTRKFAVHPVTVDALRTLRVGSHELLAVTEQVLHEMGAELQQEVDRNRGRVVG